MSILETKVEKNLASILSALEILLRHEWILDSFLSHLGVAVLNWEGTIWPESSILRLKEWVLRLECLLLAKPVLGLGVRG